MVFSLNIIGFTILGIYLAFISLVIKGLKKADKLHFAKAQLPVSILVSMRNEEENIIPLLHSILENKYPIHLFEIILANDHSTDATQLLVRNWQTQHSNININIVLPVGDGKKEAITEGLKHCQNEIILQTDADCIVPKNWIKKMSAPFKSDVVKLVAAPVALIGETWFQKLQALEFASLIASSIGLSNKGWHIMANAANLAYRKSVRQALSFKEKSKSGDDVFFIQQLSLLDSNGIVYLSDSETVVNTSAKASLKAFVQQRLRWASKTREYPNAKGIWVALLVLFINVFTLLAFVGLFSSSIYAMVFLLIRFLADFLLLNKYYKIVLKVKPSFGVFLLQSFLNPFYILTVGLASQFVKTTWKGRRV